MYCKTCAKDVETVTKAVGNMVQYNCKECGAAIAFLPATNQPAAPIAPEPPPDVAVTPVADGTDSIEYACDFGKYRGKPFSEIPVEYLKKQALKRYAGNADVLKAVRKEIDSRDE
jgi:uncharacterized protein (DUF3820 family)